MCVCAAQTITVVDNKTYEKCVHVDIYVMVNLHANFEVLNTTYLKQTVCVCIAIMCRYGF